MTFQELADALRPLGFRPRRHDNGLIRFEPFTAVDSLFSGRCIVRGNGFRFEGTHEQAAAFLSDQQNAVRP